MAGGVHAQVIACFECGARAVRTYEGVEDDHYRCEAGHEFGVDYSRGELPTEPQWPPPPDMVPPPDPKKPGPR